MATYKLEIDGSGAESGAQRIVKSFESIKAAAEKMEGGVTAAAKKASASFGDLQKAAKPISQSAINSLKELSAVFKGFRGPSDAAVRNTIMFLQGLQAVGKLSIGGTAGLASLLKAVAGFKGPTPLAGKNTESLLKALQKATGISPSRGLASVLNSLSTFKGPSAYAAKNITAMLNSLAAFKAPRGLQAATNALNALTAAANTANGAMKRLQVTTGTKMSVNVNTSGAHKNISGLIRQHSLWQMAILRTQTLYNALGGVLAGRAIINASNDIIKIRAQLEAATGSVQQARVQFAFLQEMTQKLGLDFRETSRSYGFFLGAIKGSGMSFKEAQQVFAGFSTAARALQLSTSDVDGVFRALGQIMSKGKLQAEELRQQLGDRLPGAFVRFAKALDMTKPGELDAALKKGAISGEKLKKAILEVSATLEVEFADSADKMSKTVDAAFKRLGNSFTMAAAGLGSSGLNEALISIADALRKFLESEALSNMLSVLGKAFKFLGEHIDAVAYIIGTLLLANTLKWIAAATNLTKVMAAGRTIALSFAAANELVAIGMTRTTAATLLAGDAFKALWAIMRANPFIFIASAIVGVLALMNSMKDSNEENLKAANDMSKSVVDLDNVYDAYVKQLIESEGKLTDETKALRENTIATIENNRAKLVEGATFNVTEGMYLTTGGGRLPRVESAPAINNARGSATAAAVIKALAPGGQYQAPTNQAEFLRQTRILNQVKRLRETGSSSYQGLEEFTPVLETTLKSIVRQGEVAGGAERLGYSPQEALKSVYGDYNMANAQGAGISGEPVGGGKKGGKSEAEQWAEKLERNIRSAQEAMSDLTSEADSSAKATKDLLSGMDYFVAEASIAAEAQVKAFEDTFASADEQAKGVLELAKRLQQEGKIGADETINSYESARIAVKGYVQGLQESAAEQKRAYEAAQKMRDMRQENDIQEEANALLASGASLAQYNDFLERETILQGLSAEERKKQLPLLDAEIKRKRMLADQNELINAQKEVELQRQVNQKMSGVYASGATPEVVDYYRQMYEYQAELIKQGKDPAIINGLMAAKKEALELNMAYAEMEKQYQKNVELATDMADAIVNGFKEGIESGDGFLKSIKNIFKDLKNIILDFVLYNPLRDFLKNAILGGLGGGGAGPAGGTTTSTGGGVVGTAGGGGGGLMSWLFGGGQESASTPTAGDKALAKTVGVAVGTQVYDLASGDIVVTGNKTYEAVQTLADVAAPMKTQAKSMTKLGQFFDPARNKQMFTDMKKMFSSGDIAGGIGKAIGIAGEAYAAWSMGKKLGAGAAKLVGGGFRAQAVMGGITGGAMAGYKLGSMFGPMGGAIGAGIGAVVGGVLGFLKKKPKIPSSYGSVVVGEDGIAVVGEVGKYGKGVKKVGKQMADAAAKMFNDFALNLDATLTAGSYGTFGRRKFSKKKSAAEEAFYSMLGVTSKGKPRGVEGVDWIKGTESEVQAFALIQQVRKGMITGLSSVMQTVFANTAATTMEQLEEDINVGKAYESFIKGSFRETDLAKQVREINEAWKKLSRQAKELGLSEEKLIQARDRMLSQMKEDFNYEIQQGILEFENPMLAAYNDLVKEYEATVENAIAVGGDLVAVEKYYGLKRTELMKQMAEEANNGIKKIAKDLLTSLTASSSSPLSAQAVFGTAQSQFRGLAAQIASGDYSNVDNLNTYATNYLDAARAIGSSSTSYFDIFQEVTDFLKTVSDTTAGGGAGGLGDFSDMPALPDIDTIVAEITARNAEIVTATEQVGTTIMEGTTQVVDTLNTGFGGILAALYAQMGLTPPVGAIPVSGTGVSSTAGTSSGGGASYYGGGGGGFNAEGGMVHLV